MYRGMVLILCLLCSGTVLAWENHAHMTNIVLNTWAQDNENMRPWLQQPIKAESLATFLRATRETLPARLAAIEKRLVKHEPGYRPAPAALHYHPTDKKCDANLTTCFKQAIRINPDVPTPCVVYRGHHPLDSVEEGTEISRMAVIAAGTSQPDLGLDTNLYEDNPSSYGKLYGFGKQPLGSPTSALHSQILFHMSAYNEGKLVFMMKPRLKENYPEARAYLYFELSKFAQETGHEYWSALFLGWGLHYVQDMTQPYHTNLSLGLTRTRAFYTLLEAALGYPKPFEDFKVIQENRHVLLEKLTAFILETEKPNIEAYQLSSGLSAYQFDKGIQPCNMKKKYIRRIMLPHMENISSAYVRLMHKNLPAHFVNNPDFDAEKFQDYEILFTQKMSEKHRYRFIKRMKQAMGIYGAYTRQCILLSFRNQSS